jgi:hypothetical protein
VRTHGKPTLLPPPTNNTCEQDHGERHEQRPQHCHHPQITSSHTHSPMSLCCASPTPQFKHNDGVDHNCKTVSLHHVSHVPASHVVRPHITCGASLHHMSCVAHPQPPPLGYLATAHPTSIDMGVALARSNRWVRVGYQSTATDSFAEKPWVIQVSVNSYLLQVQCWQVQVWNPSGMQGT